LKTVEAFSQKRLQIFCQVCLDILQIYRMMDKKNKRYLSTQAVYNKFLQPAYERMIIQHVYKNNITLKSGATGQLLRKRPKSTGYLGKKYDGLGQHHGGVGGGENALWPSITSEHWKVSQQKVTGYDDANYGTETTTIAAVSEKDSSSSHAALYPVVTDESNLRASTRRNTFSATTRVREVPVNGLYKKEIQQFRSRTPSGRGVRAAAYTGRSIFSPSINSLAPDDMKTTTRQPISQSMRMMKEQEKIKATKERKRLAQIATHRVDRMYYMHGSQTKIHQKYEVLPDDISRLRAIALQRGAATAYGQYPQHTNSTVDMDRMSSRMDLSSRDESVRTFIPTGESESLATLSIGDHSETRSHVDGTSADDERSLRSSSRNSIRKTPDLPSDGEDSRPASSVGILSRPGTRSPALSESALSSKKRSRSVTFLTQEDDEAEENDKDT